MLREDATLLRDYAHRGDADALAVLISRHSAWLMAFLCGMLSTDDAEDAFQEVWMRVIRTAHGYRGGVVKAYLARVARSVAIDHLRRDKKLASLDDTEDAATPCSDELQSPTPTPSEALAAKVGYEEARRALESLPLTERQVFLLRVEGELTFQEIADELKTPLGTVLTRMRNAVKRLKSALGDTI